MKRLLAIAALLLVAGHAHGATVLQASPVDSIRQFLPAQPRSIKVNVIGLRLDSTGAYVAVTAQTCTVAPANLYLDPVMFADCPVNTQKTPLALSGFRVEVTFSSLHINTPPTRPAWYIVDFAPVSIPPGKALAVRYDTPITGSGLLQFSVDGPAKDIPPPAGTGQVVTGPVAPTPTPAPAPAPTPSPTPTQLACVTMPPATTLTDSAGHVFTPLPSEPGTTEIGLSMDGSKQFGAIVKAYLLNGQVCADDSKSPGALGPLVCFVNGKQQAAAGPPGC